MKNFLQVVVFSLLTIMFFYGFSSFGIPQIQPAPPPLEEKIDLDEMTMDQFIALGDKIYNGKGTCTLCHNSLGRAPMLDTVAVVAEERMKDEKYNGEAKTPEEYILESMVKPSAFVVAGFGKAGISPMPDVSTGSIGLKDAEIKAVIAYLQDKAGADVTVEIPTEAPSEEEEEEAQRVLAKTPEEAVLNYECGMCHKVAGETGEIAPDLTHIGAIRDENYIRRSILDPNADIAKGYEADMMPADYGERLAAAELEMLVKYLAAQK